MSTIAAKNSNENKEETKKKTEAASQPQFSMLGQQVNLSLLQSLSLPVKKIGLNDKKILLTFSTAQNFSELKKNLSEFFEKNLNEELKITQTANETEIALEFPNEEISNYVYNSVKNELELISLIDSNENCEEPSTDVPTTPEEVKEDSKKTETKSDLAQLQEIIKQKKYKEYQPIQERMNFYSTVQFNTRSLRDYQKKFVSQYFIQIENDKDFQVTKILIGNNGVLLRKIIVDNCINFNDYSTKIRLRGRGSGYKEGPRNEESNDPLELCVSSLNYYSFIRCCFHIENILRSIYYQYYMFQLKVNGLRGIKERPILKKIMKYQYVVNRTVGESKN
ncbi:MAG: hypothetical protein MJ252_30325 [archaeon]|nr:hypothetical protein [archaeon]